MRRKFKDEQDDEWGIVINVATARAVKDETDVDLLESVRSGKFDQMQTVMGDPYLFGSVLSVLCKDQIVERGLSGTAFAERLASADVIDDAATQLLEATIDFFPKSSRTILRTLAAKVNAKVLAHRETATSQIMADMETDDFNNRLDDFLGSQF